jgi:hypothetical protein
VFFNGNMAAFSDLELLLLADEEPENVLLFLLADENNATTYDRTKPKATLDDFTDAQCKVFFRFYKRDIHRLAEALKIPDRIVLSNRGVENGVLSLTIFLARFAYPNRLTYLEFLFKRPKTTLSMIVQSVLDHIYDNFSEKISNLNQDWFVNRLQLFADAVHDKGGLLRNCIGFIDGTVRQLCRPTWFQRTCYNGHKRVHAIKFQSIVTPDGLIANLFGPVEGRRHDSFLLRLSGVLEQFEDGQWTDRDGNPFCIYGDPAYNVRDCLLAPYRNPNQDQAAFNSNMSAMREVVEWQFGKLIQQFAFVDFKKNLKLFLQPVGK